MDAPQHSPTSAEMLAPVTQKPLWMLGAAWVLVGLWLGGCDTLGIGGGSSNKAPQISLFRGPDRVKAGEPYEYQWRTTDKEDDPLTAHLVVNGDSLTVSPDGSRELRFAELGGHSLALVVSDGNKQTDTSLTVTAQETFPDNVPPKVSFEYGTSSNEVFNGDSAKVVWSVYDQNNDVQRVTLGYDGKVEEVEQDGSRKIVFGERGVNEVVLTAFDRDFESKASHDVLVKNNVPVGDFSVSSDTVRQGEGFDVGWSYSDRDGDDLDVVLSVGGRTYDVAAEGSRMVSLDRGGDNDVSIEVDDGHGGVFDTSASVYALPEGPLSVDVYNVHSGDADKKRVRNVAYKLYDDSGNVIKEGVDEDGKIDLDKIAIGRYYMTFDKAIIENNPDAKPSLGYIDSLVTFVNQVDRSDHGVWDVDQRYVFDHGEGGTSLDAFMFENYNFGDDYENLDFGRGNPIYDMNYINWGDRFAGPFHNAETKSERSKLLIELYNSYIYSGNTSVVEDFDINYNSTFGVEKRETKNALSCWYICK